MTILFDHPEHDDHESVLFARHAASGLRAIIAVQEVGDFERRLGELESRAGIAGGRSA